MFNFFQQVAKLSNVYRWSGTWCIEKESVKSHSYDVVVLSHLFALELQKTQPVNIERVVLYATYHDISETLTSDLPNPVKYMNPEIEQAFKNVEEVAERQMMDMLPADMKKQFEESVFENITPEEKRIVKAADIASAYFKTCQEISRGNADFFPVKENLDEIVENFGLSVLQEFCKQIKSNPRTR